MEERKLTKFQWGWHQALWERRDAAHRLQPIANRVAHLKLRERLSRWDDKPCLEEADAQFSIAVMLFGRELAQFVDRTAELKAQGKRETAAPERLQLMLVTPLEAGEVAARLSGRVGDTLTFSGRSWTEIIPPEGGIQILLPHEALGDLAEACHTIDVPGERIVAPIDLATGNVVWIEDHRQLSWLTSPHHPTTTVGRVRDAVDDGDYVDPVLLNFISKDREDAPDDGVTLHLGVSPVLMKKDGTPHGGFMTHEQWEEEQVRLAEVRAEDARQRGLTVELDELDELDEIDEGDRLAMLEADFADASLLLDSINFTASGSGAYSFASQDADTGNPLSFELDGITL